jgi:GTP-binding protein EngB required for normal cell division
MPAMAATRRSHLDEIRRLAVAAGRDDLASRLAARQRQLDSWSSIRVLVVGDFKQGKSSLVNALLGTPICPVDPDFATAVPTLVRFGAAPAATVTRAVVDAGDGDADAGPPAHPIDLDAVASMVSESGGAPEPDVVGCTIDLPVAWLAEGFEIVDMPGYGGLDQVAGARVAAQLHEADTVLFVTDASQEVTAPELALLQTVVRACSSVAVVLTKIDAYVEWRRIRDVDERKLAAAGISVPILPVSAARHQVAATAAQRGPGSGIAEVLHHLGRDVRGRADRERDADVVADGRDVLAQLRAMSLAERDALDPALQANVVSELRASLREIGEMRLDSAAWHRFLKDRCDDLRSQTIDRLDQAMSELRREAMAAIGVHDPAVVWVEFQNWLRTRATTAVGELLEEMTTDATDIEQALMRQLHEQHGMPRALGRSATSLDTLAIDDVGTGFDQRASDVALGSSWQVAEPLLGVAGFVPAFGPLSLAVAGVAALAFGRRALRQRRAHALESRREQARDHLDHYLDDVRRTTTKPVDRYAGQVYRLLRDGVLARADELEWSTSDALKAAVAAASSTESERAERRSRVAAHLATIDELDARLMGADGRGRGAW